jgi:UDP-GlcNAc:undecaprenyl-phosphate GlcNAc-1-phosphate transferase
VDPLILAKHALFAAGIFVLSAVVTYFMQRVVRVMDIPTARSSHSRPVPKSGGLAIVVSFVLASVLIYFLARYSRIDDRYFWGFLICAVCLAAVSLVDDITQKLFGLKLLTQVLCIFVMIGSGVVLTRLSLPIAGETALGWVAYPLTALWLIGLINAYNFMDGLDGMAGGVAVTAGIFLCVIAFHERSWFVYLTSYALVASVGGFLIFNFPNARIFMGDVGSAFIGFVFGALAILGAEAEPSRLSFYVVPLLLFHFIFDTFFTFVRRWMNGEPLHLAHRTHLYQLLNRTGFSHAKVSLYYWAITAVQGCAALFLVTLEASKRIYVFLPFLVYHAIFAAWVLKRARAQGILPGARSAEK